MNKLREAAQQALEALEIMDRIMQRSTRTDAAITALKAALAEPTGKESLQVEPVAWRWAVPKLRGVEWRYTLNKTKDDAQPLYAAKTKEPQ